MRQADFFIEPIVTAMLAAEATDALSAPPPDRHPVSAAGVVPLVSGAGASRECDTSLPAGTDDLTQAPVLAARITQLLDAAKNKADMAGCPQEYIEAADFAVCALIDEVLLSSSWPGRGEWLHHPLQRLRHSTTTAGEDFYRLLDMLLHKADMGAPLGIDALPTPDQKALTGTLEVFALCLAQGFTGMYFHNLPAIRERLRAIARLTPELRDAAWDEGQTLFSVIPAEAPRRKRNTFFLRFDLLDCLLWLAPPAVLAVLFQVYSSRLTALVDLIFKGKT